MIRGGKGNVSNGGAGCGLSVCFYGESLGSGSGPGVGWKKNVFCERSGLYSNLVNPVIKEMVNIGSGWLFM